VPVSAPVTACGNAVGLLGTGTASCGGSTPGGGSSGGGATGGSSSSGTSVQAVDASSAERGLGQGALRLAAKPGALAFTGSSLMLLGWLAVALLAVGCVLTLGWRRHTR